MSREQINGLLHKVIGNGFDDYVDIQFFQTEDELRESLEKYKPVHGDICRATWTHGHLVCYAVVYAPECWWIRFYIGPDTEQSDIDRLAQSFVLSDFMQFNVQPPDYTLRSGNNLLRRMADKLSRIK